MEGSIIVLVVLGVLVATGLALLVLFLRRGRAGGEGEPNYRAIFIIGLSQISIGSSFTVIYTASDLPPFLGLPLLGMGLTYVAIGLANRDKWK